MPSTQVNRSGSAFTDTTIKKLQLDPLVVDGSLFRLDFLSAYSNPNADGALANGATFPNLVEGGLAATYTLGNGGLSVITGKKGLSSPGTDSTNSSNIAFPVGSLDMHTESGDHDFICHLWYKPLAGYFTNGAAMFSDRASETSAYWGATPTQMALATGQASSGDSPYAFVRAGGNAYSTPQVPNDQQLNLATLLSAAYVGGSISLFLNGVLFGSTAYGSTALGLPSRRSHGTFVFSAAPSASDTVAINGNAITFVASGASGAQVNIGADAATTAANLRTYINTNKATLNATAEGTGTTVAVVQRDTTLLTLTKSAANITVGAVVAAKSLKLTNYLKGEYYAIAGEDLTLSGRTALASAQAEYNGYRPILTAAGL